MNSANASHSLAVLLTHCSVVEYIHNAHGLIDYIFNVQLTTIAHADL